MQKAMNQVLKKSITPVKLTLLFYLTPYKAVSDPDYPLPWQPDFRQYH
jgi:hypothetical protein